MRAEITIEKVDTIIEIPNYWSSQDYTNLLKEFDIPISTTLSEKEQIEYLEMAVSELEPNEAAKIILMYKLSNELSENQIEQISNDMLLDKISEEYPEISLHKDLFSVNQLLFKLYNGKFPNTKATSVQLQIDIANYNEPLTKPEILKLIMQMTSNSNVIKRLYVDELGVENTFEQANDIIWVFTKDNNHYSLITSEYWLADKEIKSSFLETEFTPIENLQE